MRTVVIGLLSLLGIAAPNGSPSALAATPGEPLPRTGDEIVVCGQLFHTTAPVVTWMDPGGYDAYRVERRFAPYEESDWRASETAAKLDSPNRYGLRKEKLTPEQIEKVRGGGWSLDELQDVVDQFVMHYDVCGVSRQCFKILHDHRCLSVHFMLDVDGTIYQTLDLKERAWHATTSNGRSIGIEIAQIGAYTAKSRGTLDQWYTKDAEGLMRLTFPQWLQTGLRTENFVGHPARPEIVVGEIQNTLLYQYDFTPQQYDSLTKLTATLCRVFPKLTCEYPSDEAGQVIPHVLPEAQLRDYQGLLGHYHIQENKTDPGPAFDWPRVADGAKKLMADAE
ncbi:N-acetyl-anhydromuranmyl-L-alanine amidase [Botrimarina colliarenosi]|uniref:N-acetylmuramoyl-L-alanine amidase n=1 Tax=Botrimarina colliarenosi TaxID=2528001 RepID=A0A5C6AK22_9BACT|nr:N-acetylmuramoyl-L-alanine amidase [Botrimarina colliarenosi]TWT99847.1 N-acetyl-anhydromuranmyl-L-alanine amidase [Botrimarina colliarenosi]